MADENANLYSNSASYITSYVAPLSPASKFLISEFNPTGGDLGANPSLTDGTLYGAIYAAEYIMRMSTVPSVLHVGMHALSSTYGVNANDRHASDVQTAYNAGTSIDTATLNYGFFPSAQAQGVAILNGVLRNATQVYSTAVIGGATVAATGLSPIPALYAQAYTNAAGYQSVVITNKSATAHEVTVNLGGSPAAGSLPLTFIAGTDPSTTNTSTTAIAVAIQSSASANPIPVPASRGPERRHHHPDQSARSAIHGRRRKCADRATISQSIAGAAHHSGRLDAGGAGGHAIRLHRLERRRSGQSQHRRER
jgi:hypothetical protein